MIDYETVNMLLATGLRQAAKAAGAASIVALGLQSGSAFANGCGDWPSEAFFKSADLPTVEICIDAGASLQQRDANGEAPLHWAAAVTRDPRIIARLVWNGADPNLRRRDGYTPLHMAAAFNSDPGVIISLVANGADAALTVEGHQDSWLPFPWGDTGLTALHLASMRPDASDLVVALLFSGAPPDATDHDGRNALHHAARISQDVRTVAALMLAAPDEANRADKKGGWTPLHLAATDNPNLWIVATLLAHGADPNQENDDSRLPLHMAAAYSQMAAVIAMLLSVTEEPCAEDDDGKTALAYAESNESVKDTEAYWHLHEACY